MSSFRPLSQLPKPLRQAGATLLEILIAIGIMGALTAGAAMLLDNHMQRVRTTAAAQHMAAFGSAVQAYIKDKYATFLPNGSTETTLIVTSDTLKNAAPTPPMNRYLPPGYEGMNAFGQTLCAIVRVRNTTQNPNEIYAMVIAEGGETIDDTELSLLVGTLGAAGGAIYTRQPTVIKGTMGRWQINLAGNSNPDIQKFANTRCNGLPSSGNLSKGHPVMALWFAKDTPSAYLYRDAVPGHPELNVMQTDLKFKDDKLNFLAPPTPGATITLAIVRDADTLCDSKRTASTSDFGQTVPPGTLAKDKNGNLMMCAVFPRAEGGDDKRYWRTVAKDQYWSVAVNAYSDLNLITHPCSATQNAWQTRIVKYPSNGFGPRAYTCAQDRNAPFSWRWQPLAVDDTGVLRLGFSPLRIENAPCLNNNHELGSITRNATGETLVCSLRDGDSGVARWHLNNLGNIGRYAFQIEGYPGKHFVGTGILTTDNYFSGAVTCNSNHIATTRCGQGGTIECVSDKWCTQYYAMGALGSTPASNRDPLVVNTIKLPVINPSREW